MSHKLLIDECLSPTLVQMALEAGHQESTRVRDRGWCGKKDWELIGEIIANDFILVTNNARDFRVPVEGSIAGHHAHQEIHADLKCIESTLSMDVERQRDLFAIALEELAHLPDLVN